MQGIVVRRPRDLTVAWAQKVIDRHAPGVRVSRVEPLAVDIGTTTRVRLVVEHDGLESLPRRWFVKLPSSYWRAWWITELPRLLETEVRFYREVGSSVPVPQPTVLAAATRIGGGMTLVLGDVTEFGADAGKPGDLLTAEQAGQVVEELARIHARFWGSASLEREYRWLAGPVRRLEDRLGAVLGVPLMRNGLQRAGSAIPRALHAPAMRYARLRSRAMRYLSQGPRTLVHHDCHSGNIFWYESRPGLYDWQLVRIGEGISDVAYLLATALEPETRRAHEGALLARYQRVLSEQGIKGLDAAHLRHRYRAHLTYALEAMVATLAIGGLMKLESNLELIRRAAAAVQDLDAFALESEWS